MKFLNEKDHYIREIESVNCRAKFSDVMCKSDGTYEITLLIAHGKD